MSPGMCGAGAPARETLEAKAGRRQVIATLGAIAQIFPVFMTALREIFDESAYARFLERHRLASSPVAYKEFLRESEVAKARRPRCC